MTTGNRITRKQFRVVTMPASVVSRVEELATINEQTDDKLNFEDQSHNPIVNEDTNNTIEGAVAA